MLQGRPGSAGARCTFYLGRPPTCRFDGGSVRWGRYHEKKFCVNLNFRFGLLTRADRALLAPVTQRIYPQSEPSEIAGFEQLVFAGWRDRSSVKEFSALSSLTWNSRGSNLCAEG